MKRGVENMNQKGAKVEGRTIHKHVKEKIVFLKYSISKAICLSINLSIYLSIYLSI